MKEQLYTVQVTATVVVRAASDTDAEEIAIRHLGDVDTRHVEANGVEMMKIPYGWTKVDLPMTARNKDWRHITNRTIGECIDAGMAPDYSLLHNPLPSLRDEP